MFKITTLEEILLGEFKIESINKLSKEFVNWKIDYIYDQMLEDFDFKGYTIHDSFELDKLVGFNNLNHVRELRRNSANTVQKLFRITDIGDNLTRALYMTTKHKHLKLSELVKTKIENGIECVDLVVTYDNKGNIIKINEDSDLYEIMCQMLTLVPYMYALEVDYKNALELLMRHQTPTNLDDNFGTICINKMARNCKNMLSMV